MAQTLPWIFFRARLPIFEASKGLGRVGTGGYRPIGLLTERCMILYGGIEVTFGIDMDYCDITTATSEQCPATIMADQG